MKIQAIIFVLILTISISAQEITYESFSKVQFSLIGGPNFNNESTSNAGYTVLTRIQSNLTEDLDLYFSTGYSNYYVGGFNHTYYKHVSFDDYSAYHTILFQANNIKYEMIPVNVGIEYNFAQNLLNAFNSFASIDFGYSFSNAKASGTVHDGIAGTYNNIDDIPSPFNQTTPTLQDGSTFVINFGVGLEYPISDNLNLNFRYIYQYNDAIIDGSHFLVGFTF